jgi:hypothetical protein
MKNEPTNQKTPAYAYTQHVATIRTLEQVCSISIQLLSQDRSRDPIDDILSQIHQAQNAVLYAVLPIDKAVELRKRAPWLRLILMQLDAKLVEQITGQPYNPKAEYPQDIILRALKTFEVKGGDIKVLNLDELKNVLQGKVVAVFNDTLRSALQQLVPDANFVKACGGNADCVEMNPLGNKPGLRVSFPGTAGQLTAEQMIELIRSGKARIYYAELDAVEVLPCLN